MEQCFETHQTWSNLPQMFFDRAELLKDEDFLQYYRDGAWQSLSWKTVAQQIATMSEALRNLGLKPASPVILISENRPEWLIADHAIMAAGGITTPAYTTNTVHDHSYIINNVQAEFVIVSNWGLALTLLNASHSCPTIKTLIIMDKPRSVSTKPVNLHYWDRLMKETSADLETVRTKCNDSRDDLACIIHTSGTSGRPRGVMLSHGALISNAAGAADVIWEDYPDSGSHRFFSFLPLSHAFEHTAGQVLPILIGGSIGYAQSLEKLASSFQEIRPTLSVIVPRVLEVLKQKITKQFHQVPVVGKLLLDTTLKLGHERYEKGRLAWYKYPLDALMSLLVRRKVRKRFGGRLLAFVSGGAPLSEEVGIFFDSLGLVVLQGYGQSEAAPIISCNRPSRLIRMHSTGPALKGVDVRIADDGEILVRGELVMKGYWNNEEETSHTVKDGWLHTGDIGLIDERDHIVITDRKRDILINDKGDNISPQKVEGRLTLAEEIAQAMVYGDSKSHLVALIVPDATWMTDWARARKKPPNLVALQHDEELIKAIHAAVGRTNHNLANHEKVRNFIIADTPFSTENEELTPTLKIRRHKIVETYGPRLDRLYRKA